MRRRGVLIATMICCLLCVTAIITAREPAPSFNQLTQEMREQLSLASSSEKAVLLATWITTLESEISSRPNDPGVNLALVALSDLYTANEQPNSALEVLNQVLDNTLDPGTLLSTSLRAAHVALFAKRTISDVVSYIDYFESLVEEYRVSGINYSPVFDDRYFEIDLIRGNLYSARAKQIQQELVGIDSIVIAPTIGPLLSEGSDLIGEYIKLLIEVGDESRVHIYLLQQAQMYADAASLYDAAGLNPTGGTLHNQAIELLERLIKNHNDSTSAQKGATVLLREKYFVVDSLDEYVAFAKTLAERLSPGHAILNYLTAEAHNLSRDPRTFVAANSLFDLVIQLERRWFEEEFKDHANYQWSLLGGARNSLKMGDYEGVTWRLAVLEKLELQGEVFTKWFLDTEATYAKYIANSLTTRIPEDDVLVPNATKSDDSNDLRTGTPDEGATSNALNGLTTTAKTVPQVAKTKSSETSSECQKTIFGIHSGWLLTTISILVLAFIAMFMARRFSSNQGA